MVAVDLRAIMMAQHKTILNAASILELPYDTTNVKAKFAINRKNHPIQAAITTYKIDV